jgi:hypothetical protein
MIPMMIRAAIFLCLATPALAQQASTSAQLPPLDPAVQLGVCQQQKAIFLSDSEQAQTMMRQLAAEIAGLKAKLAESDRRHEADEAALRSAIEDQK